MLAVLQLALPAFTSLVDARVEAAARAPGASAHVESATASSCPVAHAVDCGFCRYVTQSLLPPDFAPPAMACEPGRVAPPGDTILRIATPGHALPLPRAPPSPA